MWRPFFAKVIKDTSLQTQKDVVKAGFSFSQRHFSDLIRKMHLNPLQWNPDITMYQGTGKITSLYRGIVKTNPRYNYIGEKQSQLSLYRGMGTVINIMLCWAKKEGNRL